MVFYFYRHEVYIRDPTIPDNIKRYQHILVVRFNRKRQCILSRGLKETDDIYSLISIICSLIKALSGGFALPLLGCQFSGIIDQNQLFLNKLKITPKIESAMQMPSMECCPYPGIHISKKSPTHTSSSWD